MPLWSTICRPFDKWQLAEKRRVKNRRSIQANSSSKRLLSKLCSKISFWSLSFSWKNYFLARLLSIYRDSFDRLNQLWGRVKLAFLLREFSLIIFTTLTVGYWLFARRFAFTFRFRLHTQPLNADPLVSATNLVASVASIRRTVIAVDVLSNTPPSVNGLTNGVLFEATALDAFYAGSPAIVWCLTEHGALHQITGDVLQQLPTIWMCAHHTLAASSRSVQITLDLWTLLIVSLRRDSFSRSKTERDWAN